MVLNGCTSSSVGTHLCSNDVESLDINCGREVGIVIQQSFMTEANQIRRKWNKS
jgi:hypothetical protein